MWPQSRLSIRRGQTVVIIGKPGTGKSTLLRWLLREAGSVVVYDSKFDPGEWPTQPDYSIIENVSELGAHARVVLCCKADWLYDKENWNIENHPWGIALEHPIYRGNTIAVFDEALATWPVSGGHPGTHRLVQQGRSFGVILIVGSQLANNIDTRLLRMANHIFVLGPCKHQKELENLYNANHLDIEPLTRLRRHQIAYWSDDKSEWLTFRKINTKLFNRLRQKKGLHIKAWLTLYSTLLINLILFHNKIYQSVIILFCLLLMARAWKSRQWLTTIESQPWVPEKINIIGETNPKRRPTKSFRT